MLSGAKWRVLGFDRRSGGAAPATDTSGRFGNASPRPRKGLVETIAARATNWTAAIIVLALPALAARPALDDSRHPVPVTDTAAQFLVSTRIHHAAVIEMAQAAAGDAVVSPVKREKPVTPKEQALPEASPAASPAPTTSPPTPQPTGQADGGTKAAPPSSQDAATKTPPKEADSTKSAVKAPSAGGLFAPITEWLAKANRDYQGTIVKELSRPSPADAEAAAKKLAEDEAARKADAERKAAELKAAAEAQKKVEAAKQAEAARLAEEAAKAAAAETAETDKQAQAQKTADHAKKAEAAKEGADKAAAAKAAEERKAAQLRKEAEAEKHKEAEAAKQKAAEIEKQKAAEAEKHKEAEAKKAADKAEEQKKAEAKHKAAEAAEAEARRLEEERQRRETAARDEQQRKDAARKAEAERKARLAEEEKASAPRAEPQPAPRERHRRWTVTINTEPIERPEAGASARAGEDGAVMFAARRLQPTMRLGGSAAHGAAVKGWGWRTTVCRDAGKRISPPKRYTVARGDSLWRISEKHYDNGAKYPRIYRANRDRIDDPDHIYPCQRFKVPRRK